MGDMLPARWQMERAEAIGVANVEQIAADALEGLLRDVLITLVKSHLHLERRAGRTEPGDASAWPR